MRSPSLACLRKGVDSEAGNIGGKKKRARIYLRKNSNKTNGCASENETAIGLQTILMPKLAGYVARGEEPGCRVFSAPTGRARKEECGQPACHGYSRGVRFCSGPVFRTAEKGKEE
ncbi:hypothetical protein AOLI_G00160700 [Acnodon oligacanthus]